MEVSLNAQTIIRKLDYIERHIRLSSKTLLNVEDCALLLGLSVDSIYRLTHTHAIPFYKPAGRKTLYFDKDEVERWAKGQYQPVVNQRKEYTPEATLNAVRRQMGLKAKKY